MYKFVKLLDSENDKLGQLGMAQLKAGTYDPATFDMTHEDEAMIKFADTRVWFRKVGTMRGAQTPVAALKNGYITREASNKRKGAFALRVEQDKGLALIDGIPFFRPGKSATTFCACAIASSSPSGRSPKASDQY
jgi:hypothetical protein